MTPGACAKNCLENMVGIESPSAHDKAFVRSQMSGTVIKNVLPSCVATRAVMNIH